MSQFNLYKPLRSSWWTSEKGKNFVANSTSVGVGAISLLCVLPHTAFASTYRDYIRLYHKGFTVPVPDQLVKRFEKTLDLLKIDSSDRFRFAPFMAGGFDVFSVGTMGRFGIHIGLPINFRYNSVADIDRRGIRVNQQSVIWGTDEGKQLENALIVPENAQIYAIAREIKLRDSYKIFVDTTLAATALLFTYAMNTGINKKFNFYVKPPAVRVIVYTLTGLFNIGNYFALKDLTQNLFEESIDRELKQLDPVFAEGGKVFYTKLLERNKALRVLMGREGESLYTALGNDNFLFRTKHRPLVERKAFFESSETNVS